MAGIAVNHVIDHAGDIGLLRHQLAAIDLDDLAGDVAGQSRRR